MDARKRLAETVGASIRQSILERTSPATTAYVGLGGAVLLATLIVLMSSRAV